MLYHNEINPYIFVHNPRTGGTNLSHYLETRLNAIRYVNPWTGLYTSKDGHLGIRCCNLNISEYYSFGFVRNPYDREYSIYTLYKNNETVFVYNSFKDWIMHNFYWPDGHRYYGNHPFLFQQNEMFNDDVNVFKFEERTDALAEIADHIGVVNKDEFINYRGNVNSFKSEPVDYRKMYDQEMLDITWKYFRNDIELYGYSFD
jgi:hypothetical protein